MKKTFYGIIDIFDKIREKQLQVWVDKEEEKFIIEYFTFDNGEWLYNKNFKKEDYPSGKIYYDCEKDKEIIKSLNVKKILNLLREKGAISDKTKIKYETEKQRQLRKEKLRKKYEKRLEIGS